MFAQTFIAGWHLHGGTSSQRFQKLPKLFHLLLRCLGGFLPRRFISPFPSFSGFWPIGNTTKALALGVVSTEKPNLAVVVFEKQKFMTKRPTFGRQPKFLQLNS